MAQPTFAVFGLSGGELLLIFLVMLVVGLLLFLSAGVIFIAIRLQNEKADSPPLAQQSQVEPTLTCDKQVTQPANLAGSQFHDVNLTGADFENVNLTSARFQNVNLSNVTLTAAQMGGAAFKHVGPPPGADGKQERQRPVRFEEMMLCDSTFQKVDLSNVRITDCDLTGMTINGILVSELIAAYERQQAGSEGAGDH